jgi:hypothetical protein
VGGPTWVCVAARAISSSFLFTFIRRVAEIGLAELALE